MDAFRVWLLFREILPLGEIEGLEGAISSVEHNLGPPFKQQGEGSLGRANIHRLPQAV
jgi:hypothetical protein